MIPMVDLSAQLADLQEEIEAGMRSVLASGQFVLGPQVAAFEREAADYLGVRYAVSCASGTDALHLALRALGIGTGDEVITTPFSFFGTVEAIFYVGARPVFVDIDPHSLNLDASRVEAAITSATRALLPVHLFGRPAAMAPLMAIAERHGLHLIEDCAQSFGARTADGATGSLGGAGCFSFFPSKNLGAYGDGGMVTTHSEQTAASLRRLCNHGSSERYHHSLIGYNSRLDELQAVVLRAKLKRIERYNRARRHIARFYSERLKDLTELQLPSEEQDSFHVYHQYTVLLPNRDAVYRSLQAQGVGCAIHYPRPLHRQPALATDYGHRSLPVAEYVAEHCLSLPIYPELTEEQADRVAAALRNALERPCKRLERGDN